MSVDDRHVSKSDEALIKRVQKLGRIICKISRIELGEVNSRTTVNSDPASKDQRNNSLDTDSVPEKALKGKALSRRARCVFRRLDVPKY
jgi:hypothetical protein